MNPLIKTLHMPVFICFSVIKVNTEGVCSTLWNEYSGIPKLFPLIQSTSVREKQVACLAFPKSLWGNLQPVKYLTFLVDIPYEDKEAIEAFLSKGLLFWKTQTLDSNT